MKKLYEAEVPLLWDDEIPNKLRDSWISLISEALIVDELLFPRCTKPKGAVGGPTIVGFGDGSLAAFAAVVYLIWFYFCSN